MSDDFKIASDDERDEAPVDVRRIRLVAIVLLAILLVTVISLRRRHDAALAADAVDTFVTTADGARLFARDATATRFAEASIGVRPVIVVDDTRRYQTIDGFGAELTGSAAHVIAMLPDRGAALVGELFDSDRERGLGLSYLRLTIGASDFSLGSYTYDDVAPKATDPDLASFSVARDAELFSVLKKITAASNDVRLMASPWTAPAWMKTSQQLFGGGLRAEDYQTYAKYLVTYVRAMHDLGISLDVLTPQNEPLLDSDRYPSMTLSPTEEAKFIGSALGPAMTASFPDTKIVIGDHNWDSGRYPLQILRDREAARYVAGSAFHCYDGNVGEMSNVRATHPDKAIYLTECSGGAWSPDFGSNLGWDVRNLIIGSMTNWSHTVVLGNLALDAAAGPANGGCANCRGVVTVALDGRITRNVEYYVLEHASRFVRPGATRIASSQPLAAALPNVAFSNVDGSEVLIALNDTKRRLSFAVRVGRRSFWYALPPGAVVTFSWR